MTYLLLVISGAAIYFFLEAWDCRSWEKLERIAETLHDPMPYTEEKLKALAYDMVQVGVGVCVALGRDRIRIYRASQFSIVRKFRTQFGPHSDIRLASTEGSALFCLPDGRKVTAPDAVRWATESYKSV